MCDREPADAPNVPSTADFRHQNADQLKDAVERVLRARALSDKLTMKSDGPRSESALDSLRVAFPFGKPVSTFPGHALISIDMQGRLPTQ